MEFRFVHSLDFQKSKQGRFTPGWPGCETDGFSTAVLWRVGRRFFKPFAVHSPIDDMRETRTKLRSVLNRIRARAFVPAGLVMSIIAAMTVLAAPANAVPLLSTDIKSITIDSTWGGLGPASNYRTRLVPGHSGFVRTDGTFVSQYSIDAFLVALNRSHPSKVLASDVGLSDQSLHASLHDVESALGQARGDRGVRQAFESIYLNDERVQPWIEQSFQSFHTDDYPEISVLIVTSAGDIALSSRSQHFFMLPFKVTRLGITAQIWDAAVPRTLAKLLANGATNKSRLAPVSLIADWANAVAQDKTVEYAEKRAPTQVPSHLQDIARRFGLELTFAKKSDHLDFPGTMLRVVSLPRLRLASEIDAGATDAEARVDLGHARDALAAFGRARWMLGQISTRNGDARIYVMSVMGPRQPDFRGEAIHGLRYRGLDHAASCFERSHIYYYNVDIWFQRRSQSSWWLLLENGDLILNQAAPDERLPEGSILRSNGSVELPNSSLPC